MSDAARIATLPKGRPENAARAAFTQTQPALLAAILDELRGLRADLNAHTAAVLAALERRWRRPRDEDDRHVVLAIGDALDGTETFTSAAVCRFSRLGQHPDAVVAGRAARLRRALVAADCTGAKSLGWLLVRVDGHDIGPVRIDRTSDQTREGVVWRLRVVRV